MSFEEYTERSHMDFRVRMYGIVTAYDPVLLCATIQPAIRRRVMGEQNRIVAFEAMQPIENVPVEDLLGVRFIPEINVTHGTLVFHDLDIDQYLLSREISNPDTARFHDYSDCSFIPSEMAKTARPEPYLVIGCNFIWSKKDFQIDGNLFVQGNIDATGDISTSMYSLNDLGLNFVTHTHAVSGAVTAVPNSVLIPPIPPEPKVCPIPAVG